MVGLGLIMGLINHHAVFCIRSSLVNSPGAVLERAKERKQCDIRELGTPLLVFLKDSLSRCTFLLFEIDDGADVVLSTTVEVDDLTAAREKGNTKQQMTYLLCCPIALTDKSINDLGSKRQLGLNEISYVSNRRVALRNKCLHERH